MEKKLQENILNNFNKYRTIVIDPPWMERGGGKIRRGADKHYSLLHTDQIISLLQQELADKLEDDAHMYMWTTNSFLRDGLRVMEALDFKYKTNIVWAKTKIGIGQYFRGQHELCLFGTRGKGFAVRTLRRDLSSLVGGKPIPATVHSRKPEQMYDLIEARSHGPYLEMFARSTRIGWDSWGDQLPLEISNPTIEVKDVK